MSLRVRQLACALLYAQLVLLGACGAGSDGAGDGPPVSGDTVPPTTSAYPPGGLYPVLQFVTLTSSEPATIYYTKDGSTPSVGGVGTFSGPSPLVGIHIDHPLTLRYFGVDAANNQEFPKAETYTYDLDPPGLFLCGGSVFTGPYGFLEQLELCFSSDETVNYLAEIGGDGTPGDGEELAEGLLASGQLANVPLPCWKLSVGQQNPGNSVWVHVADFAGGITSHEFVIETLDDAAFPAPGTSNDLELTSDGKFGYLLRPELTQVWKFDTDPMSASFNTVLAQIDVLANPTSMDIVADGSRVYITGDEGYSEVDAVTDAVIPIPMPSSLTPSGIDIHGQAAFGLVGASDGTYWHLDVDPGSTNFRVPTPLPIQTTFMQTAEVVLGPNERKALVTWTSMDTYKLQVLDTDPQSSGFLSGITQLIAAPLPDPVGTPVINQAGTSGWVSNEDGFINLVDLVLVPPELGLGSASIGVRGMTLSPDESLLLLTGETLNELQMVDPATLEGLAYVPAGGSSGSGTTRALRYTPDGKRAYLVRDNGSASGEIWMLRLTSE